MNSNKNEINSETKYNCLKDSNFWFAFVIGGGISLINMFFAGMIFHPVSIIGLSFLISWEAWIIFKKGRRGSFVTGFVIAMIVAIIVFFLVMKIVEKQQEQKMIKTLKELREDGAILDKEGLIVD